MVDYRNTILADSPLSYMRLGESSGTTIIDATGNHNGTYSSTGVTLGQTGALFGDANAAAAFDGLAGHGTIPGVTTSMSGNWSVKLWFKAASVQNGATIISSTTSSGGAWKLYWFSGDLKFGTDGVSFGVGSGGGWADSNYHHLIVSRTGGGSPATVMYIDGLNVTTGTYTDTPGAMTGYSIGGNGSGGSLAAVTIDEVAFYNVALTQKQAIIYYAAANVKPTGSRVLRSVLIGR